MHEARRIRHLPHWRLVHLLTPWPWRVASRASHPLCRSARLLTSQLPHFSTLSSSLCIYRSITTIASPEKNPTQPLRTISKTAGCLRRIPLVINTTDRHSSTFSHHSSFIRIVTSERLLPPLSSDSQTKDLRYYHTARDHRGRNQRINAPPL